MKDGKALELLLEFISNPMVLKAHAIQKYYSQDMPELMDDNSETASIVADLSEIVEDTLDYLAEQGIATKPLMAGLLCESEYYC